MDKFKITTCAAILLASLSFSPVAFAEGHEGGGDGGCERDCDPGPEPEPEPEPEPRQKGNNGLGNGDQPAPGNSLDRNKAENQVGAPGHPSGKAQKPD